MRRLLISLSLFAIFTFTAFSQTNPADAPASKEDVEKYLQVMQSHEMMHKMVDAMAKPMRQMVHEQYLKDQDKLPPDFEDRMNQTLDSMFKDLPFDQMLDAMVPAYQKHFTKGDLDALIAFYSTPTGQKILRELPAITAEAMQTMMPLLRENIDKMNTRLQHDMTEMAKNHKTAPATSTPN